MKLNQVKKGLTYSKKNKGPSTEPCATPACKGNQEEKIQ